MTPLMLADEIAQGFNASAERQYWRASTGGTRTLPTVNFNSRGSMVQFVYYVQSSRWSVAFSKTQCAFGDYMASVHRSLAQVLMGLKAAGLDFAAPLDEAAACRFEYDPATKETYVHLANAGDDWLEAMPVSFKVPEQIS